MVLAYVCARTGRFGLAEMESYRYRTKMLHSSVFLNNYVTFWLFLRLFDQTPYFRVKRFLQTVFGNVLVGSYFVQRNRNIAAAAPLSGLVPNSKSGIRAILKNGLGIFFENPKPICTGRASWIYFSRLVVLIPAILT